MEKLSKIAEKKIIPVEIEIQPYLRDHHIGGRVVIPAVETCQRLSGIIKKNIPDVNSNYLYDAAFDKFIDVKPDQKVINANNEIELFENGDVISRLLTKTRIEKSGITRTKEHVILKFKKEKPEIRELPFDMASSLDGICYRISSEKIYEELVLFGKEFQNVTDTAYLTRNGIIANVKAPVNPAPTEPLGSPFPFDAALHAACIWCQRFSGIVAFPVGFEKRFIVKPTVPGKAYLARIVPIKKDSGLPGFDIWVYDADGNLYEAAYGVKLKDVSAGKINPPDWILNDINYSLKNISKQCEDVAIVEEILREKE